MKHLFNNISREEKQRILEMHKSATKRNYLTEDMDLGMGMGMGKERTLSTPILINEQIGTDPESQLILTSVKDHKEGAVFIGKYRGAGKKDEKVNLLYRCLGEAGKSKIAVLDLKGEDTKVSVKLSDVSMRKLEKESGCGSYSYSDSDSGEEMA